MEVFLLWIVFSIAVGAYASSKARSGVGFFFLSLLLSPLIGFIWVAVSASNPAGKGLRKCPQCAEWIQPEALKCRFCSFDFAAASDVIAPISPLAIPEAMRADGESEESLKWLLIPTAVVVLVLIGFWAIQFVSAQNAKANEESAIASVRVLATACIVYDASYAHGYPAKLSFLGPPSFGAGAGDFGADLVGKDLASGAKGGYVFEYAPGRKVRGKIVGFQVIARPISGVHRAFYVDQTAVVRSSVGEPSSDSNPI